MKTKLVMLGVVLLMIGMFGIVSASTTLTIKGKVVDQLTGLPVEGAKLMSAYEFSPSEVVTDSSGNFQFTTTDDFKRKEGAEAGMPDVGGGWTFYDANTNCYDYGSIGLQKNYEVWQNGQKVKTYGLALTKRAFDSREEVSDVSGKSVIDVGNVKMQPTAELKTKSDIESSMEIQYRYKNSQGYNGGGDSNYNFEHSSLPGVPIDYDVFIRFTERNGIKHESSTFHVPLDARCKTVYLDYENGNSEWEVIERGVDTNFIEIELRKGWNLIQFNDLNDLRDDSEITKEDIVVEYLYFPGYNKYIKVYPEQYSDEVMQQITKLGLNEQTFQEYQKYLINSGAWIYSKKSGKLKVNNGGDLEAVYSHKIVELKAGWNFKTISPSMKNKKFSEIKGNCNIQRMAEWKADTQKWDVRDFADVSSAGISKGDVNKVAAFKVASDCKFGDSTSAGGILTPPAIPA